MKMVKKCIFALAVVALLVTVVPAATPDPDNQPDSVIKRDGDWPWTYKAIDLCTMPILMDVGHFVQLKECHKREIRLKQVPCGDIGKKVADDFPCYLDCEEIEVRANFDAIFGAKVAKNGPILDKVEAYWDEDKDQIEGNGTWQKLKVCVKAWKAQIWNASEPADKTNVGSLTITVKPPDGGTP